MQDTEDQLRRAAFAVRDMRERLEAERARAHSPVAIVGMGCRFPGAPDLAAYWQLLIDGCDAITVVPKARWDADALYDPDPDAPGKASSKWGGFIDGVDLFDAEFFGMSPREAKVTDPQQRLLLETAWRALEHAGLPVDRLPARKTGVYVGISTNDYAGLLAAPGDLAGIDAHASLGNSVAVAAGRLSYTFGLQGPAMSIDTACSSSLVALHLALGALRKGEIDVALVAGVNLTLTPGLTIGFSKARMMAADGRCKTFDAAADGYVRGEGCGVVVLKRQADAVGDGDRICAIVLGSAVNQDGRSNGLTAPNGPAQEAVIRAALADARVDASDIGLFEAHGTGTALGDPIEARALGQVIGHRAQAEEHPYLGSVKTNIGHLEAAAGIAGLIKTALALEHRVVPPHINFSSLNPHIAQDHFPFRIPLKPEPLPGMNGRLVAGVSSFGFSGTNAHVVLEAPPATRGDVPASPWSVIAISARDAASAEAIKTETLARLGDPTTDFPAFAASLATGRATMPWRLAIAADDPGTAREALQQSTPRQTGDPPRVAFLFTGQGSQYGGMAKGLLGETRFRETLSRCDAVLDGMVSRIVSGGSLPDGRTDLVQPLLVSIEYAVADLWRSWGVEPALVIGHSVGEIAAAAFSGAIELEDALRFVSERGRLMESRAGIGTMAAVLAPAEAVERLIAGTGAVIAAYNAPENTVISGANAAMNTAITLLEAEKVQVVPLQVATAFHSPVLDPVLDGIALAASSMRPSRPRTPLIANLTGRETTLLDATYWRSQAAAPVRFADCMRVARDKGCSVFVEVGPQPVLSGFGRSVFQAAQFVPSLRRGMDDTRMMAEARARLFAAGAAIDWQKATSRHKRVDVPVHPLRRERHWPDMGHRPLSSATRNAQSGRLVGEPVDTPCEPRILQRRVSTASLPFLGDHVVFGDIVVPGAMFAMMAISVTDNTPRCTEDMVFEAPLRVPPDGLILQTLTWDDGRIEIHGRPGNESPWMRHVRSRLCAPMHRPRQTIDLARRMAGLEEAASPMSDFFDGLSERGIALGPSFRGIRRLWRGNGEAMAEIVQPEGTATLGVPLHPAALDACFQVLGATFRGEGGNKGFMPLSLDRLDIWAAAPREFICLARVEGEPGSSAAIGHFDLCDQDGHAFARIEGLQIKQVEAPDPVKDMLVGTEWIPASGPEVGWGSPPAIAAGVAGLASTLAPITDTGLSESLDALAATHAARCLAELATPGPVMPRYARLQSRLRQLAAKSAGLTADALRVRFPGNAGEIDLVDRCGRALPGILAGTIEPLDVLFANDRRDADLLYSGEGLASRASGLVARSVSAALARRGNRRLSILEIGAGTGATTRAILDDIPDGIALTYVFTDISEGFLAQARQTFAHRKDMSFARFDLEGDPAAQQLGTARFDIVVAANVVHATRDVAQSLAHILKLIAPHGIMVLLESTARQDWWDIVFGLTEGWWRFSDQELRADHALLNQAQWIAVVAAAGFISPEAIPVDDAQRQSVIIAGAPPRETICLVHDASTGRAAEVAAGCLSAMTDAGQDVRIVGSSAAQLLCGSAHDLHLVYLGGLSGEHGVALHETFDLARCLARSARGRLSLATWGSQQPAHPQGEPGSAALAGFARVMALELGDLGAHVIDLDPSSQNPGADLARALTIADTSGEREILVRDGTFRTARLMPKPLTRREAPAFRMDGTYLITGAFGGLGPHLAKWLAHNGAGHLVLAGRHLPDPAAAESLRMLAPRVEILAMDVSDDDALATIARRNAPTLRGIFHLAGAVADGTIVGQDWETFASILKAKAGAALALDRLTADLPLDHFVLFSTSAALIGNPGQANHAAANAVMDAVARRRRATGLPGLSVNWGAFAEAGAIMQGDRLQSMLGRGVKPISIEQGLDALGRLLTTDVGNIGVISVDWPQFMAKTVDGSDTFLSHFRSFTNATAARPLPAMVTVDFGAALAGLKDDARRTRLAELIAAEAAAVLGITDMARIDPDQPLSELGLDSLLALELRSRLSAASGQKQAATLLFDNPSIAALTDHFDMLYPSGKDTPVAMPDPKLPQAQFEAMAAAEIETMSDAEIEALLEAEYRAATASPAGPRHV